MKIDTKIDQYLLAIFQSYEPDTKLIPLDRILTEYNVNTEKEELEYIAYRFQQYIEGKF